MSLIHLSMIYLLKLTSQQLKLTFQQVDMIYRIKFSKSNKARPLSTFRQRPSAKATGPSLLLALLYCITSLWFHSLYKCGFISLFLLSICFRGDFGGSQAGRILSKNNERIKGRNKVELDGLEVIGKWGLCMSCSYVITSFMTLMSTFLWFSVALPKTH